jgi:tetratricopeptide (TPR) repeat protein
MHAPARVIEEIDQQVNTDNPWPGLTAFTEENAFFFHGRDNEADELFRLIKRETLTVLFGLSGLGKTSLLQAGIFPFLRREDFLPVYVRLNYAEAAPHLVSQVKETLREVSAKADISSPPIRPNETLWAYFHRSTNEFRTNEGRLITPVLIFDQFEEMFTLGSHSEECRQRISALSAELGDLIENRPPEAVARQLESDGDEAYSFYKSDFKVVFSLREDFLANLEGLSNQLPSIAHNRFRLQKMNGGQAFEVVLKSGGALVEKVVAEKIVRIVAGQDAFANGPLTRLEIEPTLLSVFCRELNNNRIAQSDSRITTQLLTGSKEVILTGFYDRALRGFEDRVRAFIEDKLLTGSGYRNNVDLQDALTTPGVSRETISKLIDRRLLRIEDGARMPRLELTHDVLTDVIKKSRDERKAREAALEAENRAAQADREIRVKDMELRRAKRRNWQLKCVCFLALVCLVASIWQWWEANTAKQMAIAAKQKIRASNDSADILIDFILSDLQGKLSGLGRVSLLDDAANKALPLLEAQKRDEGGMSDTQLHFQESAFRTLGDVLKSEAKLPSAMERYDRSISIARQLANHNPGISGIGYQRELAELLSGPSNPLSGSSKADVLYLETKYPEVSRLYDESLQITRKVEKMSTKASEKLWVDQQLANIYGRQGDVLRQLGKPEEALATFYRQSLELRKKAAAMEPNYEPYQLDLAYAYSRIGMANNVLGHYEEARLSYEKALEIRKKYAQLHQEDVNWQRSLFYSYLTLGRLLVQKGKLDGENGALAYLTIGLEKEKILALQNPENKDLQRELAVGYVYLGNFYRAQGQWQNALDNFNQSLGHLQMLSKLDTSNLLWENFLGVSYLDVGDAHMLLGEMGPAAESYQSALKIFAVLVGENSVSTDWRHNLALVHERIGYLYSLQGKTEEAEESYRQALKTYQVAIQANQKDPVSYNGKAWLLATCPLAEVRNGPQAVQDAAEACRLTERESWEDIDTLAAADAEAGNFTEAIANQQAAIKLIDASDPNEIAGMNSRLSLYQNRKACHLSPPVNSDR